MKYNRTKIFAALLTLAVVMALLAPPAQAQVTAKEFRNFTNVVVHVGPSSVSNIVCILPLRSGKNTEMFSTFNTSGAGTDVVTWWFKAVPDGTNEVTTGNTGEILQVAANGTTVVRAQTNLLASKWDGIAGVSLSISNASGTRTVYVTNTLAINSR